MTINAMGKEDVRKKVPMFESAKPAEERKVHKFNGMRTLLDNLFHSKYDL